MKEWQKWEYWSVTSLYERVTLDGIASAGSCTSQDVRGSDGFSDRVLKNITWGWSYKGAVEVLLWVQLHLLCPFSRIWSAASSEPLGCDAFLSNIHAGKGNSKCYALTLWSTLPLPRCFISEFLVSSHIIKCACLSPGSPLIFLWFSCLV